jgi:ATP-dependent RNA helicase DeaD
MMINAAIAAPLAQALASKGYDTLTPVQTAILEPQVAGRDLLVSAQTGSGKTAAFGLAIAPEVLAGSDLLLYADVPAALIIAPTRELALQVAAEFEWLYGPAEGRIATCVGGMDYRTERRALDRGAHIVVGTPGRLRDHIERGSLKLEMIRAVVLDEADEMLDMGFEEDLKFILGACPQDRRTLMFSATVPKEIEALARAYQKDALRIAVKSEAAQHADIDYRAYSVAPRDREPAIFNLLRFHEARTAIVFCKTRANVSHLFARMTNRGFQAVALSGELSQSERTHALQALRDGRARVCIATDVAARGIDLPGLELVIHADLPGSSETLLHRSGRTGRAGRKGISALIVAPAEFRKAQRLLQGAKLVADWGKPPGADEVQEREDLRLVDHPLLAADPAEEGDLARTLLDQYGPDRVAAAFIRLWREGRSAPEELSDNLPPPAAAPLRERGVFGPSVWFRLSKGHTERAEARWLLPKICEAGGITKDAIGAIRVQQDHSFVQILATHAKNFGAEVELEQGLTMARIEGEPDLARPERPQRSERPQRPERPAPRPATDEAPRAKSSYMPKPPRLVEDEAAAPVTAAEASPDTSAEDRKPRHKPREAAPAPAAPQEPPRKAWTPREDAPRRPYAPREDAPRKPYAPRDDAARKPYAKPAEASARKPYAKSDTDAPRKPWAPREDGPRKPYARSEGDAPRKPYAPREDGPRKPYARADGDAQRKPYAPREEGAKKPYAKPADGARKPYAPRDAGAGKPAAKFEGGKPWAGKPEGGKKPYAPKSAGFKSHGGGEGGPARAAGFKSHASAGKPTRKPAPVQQDPTDTSRRFVPPKKPKG